MKVLIFDVETTGLLPRKKEANTEYPYITQLSFAIYDIDKRQLVSTYNTYICVPETVEITENITKLTGVTRMLLNACGISIITALQMFYKAYSMCDVIVAHNLDFDKEMIQIETKRNFSDFEDICQGMSIMDMFNITELSIKKKELLCTMKTSVDICNIKKQNSRGSYKKFPNLCELYETLFHTKPENLHNSMIDVLVCLKCYLMIHHQIHMDDCDFSSYI